MPGALLRGVPEASSETVLRRGFEREAGVVVLKPVVVRVTPVGTFDGPLPGVLPE